MDFPEEAPAIESIIEQKIEGEPSRNGPRII